MIHTRTKIVASIVGGVCVLSVLALIGFQYVLVGLKSDLTLQEKKVLETKTQDSRLASLERLIEETETERAEIAKLILTEEGVVDFLALIETLGAEQGVTLKTESLTAPESAGLYDELSISLSVKGTERSVGHMLRLFETLPYRSTVEQVILTKDESDGLWQGTFDLRVTKYKKI